MSRPIEETVRLLESLVENQDKALKTSREIISGKDKLIKLCEEQTELYRKENNRLKTSLTISAIIFACLAAIDIIRLLF